MKFHLDLLRNIRTSFLKELNSLSHEQLNLVPEGFNNNIIWNVAHSLVIQQLLCYSLSDTKCPVEKHILKKYKNGTVPTDDISENELTYIKKMLLDSVDILENDFNTGLFKSYKEYTVGFKTHLTSVEEAIIFNNAHEGLHFGFLSAIKKML